MTYKTKGKSLYKTFISSKTKPRTQTFRVRCSTCDSSATMRAFKTMPDDWEQDKLGELHCGKCMQLARALIEEDRRQRKERS